MRQGLLGLILGGLTLLGGCENTVQNPDLGVETRTVTEPVYRTKIEGEEKHEFELSDFVSGKIDDERFKEGYQVAIGSNRGYSFPLGKYEGSEIILKGDDQNFAIPTKGIGGFKIIFYKRGEEVVLPAQTKELRLRESPKVYQTLPVYSRELENGDIEYSVETPEGVQTETISNK
jgi:hypothetical protein